MKKNISNKMARSERKIEKMVEAIDKRASSKKYNDNQEDDYRKVNNAMSIAADGSKSWSF